MRSSFCWTPFDLRISGTPYSKYSFKSGYVSHKSPFLSEGRIALAWGVNLVEWYQLDPKARAAMIAIYEANQVIESGNAQEAQAKAEREAKK